MYSELNLRISSLSENKDKLTITAKHSLHVPKVKHNNNDT